MKSEARKKILEIKKHLIEVNDLQDEYLYYDEVQTKKVLGEVLKGYKSILEGTIQILKKV